MKFYTRFGEKFEYLGSRVDNFQWIQSKKIVQSKRKFVVECFYSDLDDHVFIIIKNFQYVTKMNIANFG